MTLSAEEDRRRLKLYCKGYSDKMIAEEIGVHPSTVSKWRKKRRLPWRCPSNAFTLPDEEEKRRTKLYRKGYTDTEIAEGLGIERAGVASWRRLRGLPSHTPKEEYYKERLRLYCKGYTDMMIAEKQNVAYDSIRQWREQRGLPPCQYVKRCIVCGRGFESVRPEAKVCSKQCEREQHKKRRLIRKMRSRFAELAELNPEKAKRLREEMRKEESDEFTDMALDGVYENVVERKKKKEEEE